MTTALERMGARLAVLDLLRIKGPMTAGAIADMLEMEEREVRSLLTTLARLDQVDILYTLRRDGDDRQARGPQHPLPGCGDHPHPVR